MANRTFALRIWAGLVYLFLFLPILIVMLMSFNASRYSTLPASFIILVSVCLMLLSHVAGRMRRVEQARAKAE